MHFYSRVHALRLRGSRVGVANIYSTADEWVYSPSATPPRFLHQHGLSSQNCVTRPHDLVTNREIQTGESEDAVRVWWTFVIDGSHWM